jgi:hypothetical protein
VGESKAVGRVQIDARDQDANGEGGKRGKDDSRYSVGFVGYVVFIVNFWMRKRRRKREGK